MFLFDGPETADFTILLAHGAGAAMDSAAMTAASAALSSAGIRVARFEFGYMAARRTTQARKPPPKAELLVGEYRAAIRELGASRKLVVGGKSMGGRVASMIADEEHAAGRIAGLVCAIPSIRRASPRACAPPILKSSRRRRSSARARATSSGLGKR
jgi:predicted alpha/beta-hydrolase family hydrolase